MACLLSDKHTFSVPHTLPLPLPLPLAASFAQCTRAGRLPFSRRAQAQLSSSAQRLKKSDEPISFSKTAASKTRIEDTLGVPKGKENVVGPYIALAFGTLLCGAMAYKILTTDSKTKKEYFEQELFAPAPEVPSQQQQHQQQPEQQQQQ